MQHLSQNLAVINDFAFIRDLSPIVLLHFFEPREKVLLKTNKVLLKTWALQKAN